MTTQAEPPDVLDIVREVASRAHQRVTRVDSGTANGDDLVLALTGIAEELRTANLLAAAALASNLRNDGMSPESRGILAGTVTELWGAAFERLTLPA